MAAATDLITLELTDEERNAFLDTLGPDAGTPWRQDRFSKYVRLCRDCTQLPGRLTDAAQRLLSRNDSSVALHIKNVPVDDVQSGYTKDASVSELVLLSVSLLFGRPLGYSDKSGGAPIQDLYPKRAHAVKQLGTGSVPLVFHTEDPHLLFSPDYVALLCLRGDPNAATEFAKIELADLDPETVPELEKPQFVLRSDESFDTSDRSLTTSIVSIDAFGTRVRYEPIFVEFLNERGREALEALTNYIHSHAERVVLDKGEMLILDNRRAVHGRSGYQPRYDGKDRWVQRSNIFLEEVPDHIVSSSNPFLML